MKTLKNGTTIQEVFSNYARQYLNERSAVFVKPDIIFDESEKVKEIIADTQRLTERLKEVESALSFYEAMRSAVEEEKEEE
ncbi:MAG: hypothetical protein J6C82_02565 [Clostridia bacterium]|nr:hypothetical protein [Clostridia bacterium]